MNKNSQLKILFVEDNAQDYELAVKRLTKDGLKFDSTNIETIEEINQTLESFQPDLVITDYKMANFTGLDVIKKLHKKDPLLPVIILTGSLNEETAVDCMKAGATNYILKANVFRLSYAIKDAIKKKEERIKNLNAEKALVLSEQRLKKAQLMAKVGYWDWDLDTGDGEWSDNVYKIFGIDPNTFQVTLDSLKTLIHKDDLPRYLEAKSNAIKQISNFTIEYRIVKPDKGIIHIHETSEIICDEKGECNRLSGIIQDITERVEAVEEIQYNEKRIRSLLKAIPDMMFVFSKDGVILDYNLTDSKSLLMPPEYFLDKHITKVLPEALSTQLEEKLRLVFDTGQPQFYEYELELDGNLSYFESRLVLLNGESALSIVRNITEQHFAKEELSQSEARYKFITENIADVVWIVDMVINRFVYVSPSMLKLKGFTPEEIMSKLATETFTESTNAYKKKHIPERVKKFFENPDEPIIYYDEFEELCKDGSTIWIEASSYFSINPHDGHLEIIGTSRNIDERRKAEEELRKTLELFKSVNEDLEKTLFEKNKLIEEIEISERKLRETNAQKDKLFSIISHDLRSPFHGLLGITQMLAENVSDFSEEELPAVMGNLYSTTQNVFRLLQNLLEWSRFEHGLITFEPKELFLKELLINNLLFFETIAAQKKIKIVNLAENDFKVEADKDMINSILRNLLSNAIKFTKRGGEVKICAEDYSDAEIKVTVEDNGIGIAPSIIDYIFSIEKKFSCAGTEGEPSSGLGLVICKEFVEKHNCKIWVDSQEHKGSKFYFTLPKSS